MEQLATKSKFYLDGIEGEFTGHHFPADTWNSFACPRFDVPEIYNILKAIKNKEGFSDYFYDSEEHSVTEIGNDGQIYTLEPLVTPTEEGCLILFPLGSQQWSWCDVRWDEENN